MSSHSQEPTWNELLSQITWIEVKIWGCASGVPKKTRRKLWVAIQRLRGFMMNGSSAENIVAFGRDRQGWIKEQLAVLLGSAEGEAIPQRLPSILHLVNPTGRSFSRSTDTRSEGSVQSPVPTSEPTWNQSGEWLLMIDAKISQHASGLEDKSRPDVWVEFRRLYALGVKETTRRDLWIAFQRLYAFIMEAVTDEHVAAAGRERQQQIDEQLSLLGFGARRSEPRDSARIVRIGK